MKKTLIKNKFTPGDIVEAEIFRITSFGAFVKLSEGQRGFIHISQIAEGFVKDISSYLKLGDTVKARILSVNGDKIDLTLKKPREDILQYSKGKSFKHSPFEDKLKEMDLSRGGAVR